MKARNVIRGLNLSVKECILGIVKWVILQRTELSTPKFLISKQPNQFLFVKVRKSQKEIDLFSFPPKTNEYPFLNSNSAIAN